MNYISNFLQSSDLQLVYAVPSIRSTILLLATFAAFMVSAVIVVQRFPNLGFRLRGFVRAILRHFFSHRFTAPLTEVACRICQRGTALFDPVYVDYKGHPHIEGNCNSCGAYIRVRLH